MAASKIFWGLKEVSYQRSVMSRQQKGHLRQLQLDFPKFSFKKNKTIKYYGHLRIICLKSCIRNLKGNNT